MFNPLAVLGDALDMGWRGFVRGLRGHRRFPGTSREIAEAIARGCWNGTYLQGSLGHFHQFWPRDQGMCAPAYLHLGMRDELTRSLDWALGVYERAGKVTTTIFPRERPVDIYHYGADTLPFLVFALRVAEASAVVGRHRSFLQAEVDRFYRLLLDPATGLVTRGRTFSEPKDCMRKVSSMFSNVMLAFLARELDRLGGFRVPFDARGFEDRLKTAFWKGDHFIDDLSEEPLLSGDANTWPFWTGVVGDPGMLRSALERLEREGLATPLPLKYFSRRLPARELFFPRIFTPNYQGDTIWPQVGMIYLDLLARVDRAKARTVLAAYGSLIEREGNFLEIHRPDLRPFRGPLGLYRADEGMIWAALYVELHDRLAA